MKRDNIKSMISRLFSLNLYSDPWTVNYNSYYRGRETGQANYVL